MMKSLMIGSIESSQGYMMQNNCGFALVNKGKHCVLNGHCIVCSKEEPCTK